MTGTTASPSVTASAPPGAKIVLHVNNEQQIIVVGQDTHFLTRTGGSSCCGDIVKELANDVTLTISSEPRGLFEIALRAGMNHEKRLSTLDCVANIAQDIHSGGLVEWRPARRAISVTAQPSISLIAPARSA